MEAPMSREAILARTFVELADTLVDDFDVVDLLTILADRCVEVLDVAAAGLMLMAPEGDLRVVASSSEGMRIVELFEIQSQEGPCTDCHRTGEAVLNQDINVSYERWPLFAPVAFEAGFRSVHALPMRLRGDIIGALNLFSTRQGAITEADAVLGQALADVATIGILQHRAIGEVRSLNEHLHYALNSRVAIEQAKGVVAERAGVTMQEAFERIRNHARNHNHRLVDVAQNIVKGDLVTELLDAPRASRENPSIEAPTGE
jgi:transcriptional regulator with GAF, ATPase, and Fis domain